MYNGNTIVHWKYYAVMEEVNDDDDDDGEGDGEGGSGGSDGEAAFKRHFPSFSSRLSGKKKK